VDIVVDKVTSASYMNFNFSIHKRKGALWFMNHKFVILLPIVTLFTVVRVALPQTTSQTTCPPGQSLMYSVGPDGKIVNWCYHGVNPNPGLAHDAPVKGSIMYCAQDSECPGMSRCEHGICGRTNMGCRADAECKSSEACDATRNRCVDKAGKY
jgi:hypothetical protein